MEQVFAEDISNFFTPGKTFTNIGSVVSVIVPNVFVLAGLVALVLLIFGGFTFIVSAGSGDTKKLETAKKTITGAIGGLILIVASFWIVQIIETLTGLSILPK